MLLKPPTGGLPISRWPTEEVRVRSRAHHLRSSLLAFDPSECTFVLACVFVHLCGCIATLHFSLYWSACRLQRKDQERKRAAAQQAGNTKKVMAALKMRLDACDKLWANFGENPKGEML